MGGKGERGGGGQQVVTLAPHVPCSRDRFLLTVPLGSSEGVFSATEKASAEMKTLKSLAFYLSVGVLVFLASSTKRTQTARFFSFLGIAVCLFLEVRDQGGTCGSRCQGALLAHVVALVCS
jgi:hypothetical protein